MVLNQRAEKRYNSGLIAAVAQLVERNLAKVEVESSRLFCRSSYQRGKSGTRFPPFHMRAQRGFPRAGWQSGYAAACKAVDAGSIPTPASRLSSQKLPSGLRR